MHQAQAALELFGLLVTVLAEPILHVVQFLDGVLAPVDVVTLLEVRIDIFAYGLRIDDCVTPFFLCFLIKFVEIFLEVPHRFLHTFGLLSALQFLHSRDVVH